MWSTGEGNSKPLQNSCLETPMNSMKRQKVMTIKDKFPRWKVTNILLEEWRNNPRKIEEMGPK